MSRYQLRIHENQILEDVIENMASQTWGILLAWKVFERIPTPKDFDDFRTAIYLGMVPFIRCYELCGYSNICLDPACSTDWAPPAHDLTASPRDLVYQLFPGTGLEPFLDGLTHEAAKSIPKLIEHESRDDVQSLIRAAFRAILGEHLFLNPFCGKTELCVFSSMSPQKVLGKHRT